MLPSAVPASLLPRLRQQAAELGFDLFGVSPVVTPTGYSHLLRWIDAGYAAEMHYFAARAEAYGDPRLVLAGARSILVLSYPYERGQADSSDRERPSQSGGIVARYARSGLDYHDVIHPKLKLLAATIGDFCPEAQSRGVVDTAPLMEREFATLAGLGWGGKNSLLLSRQRGSYFFLASLLTTLDLPASEPHLSAHCGSCTRCLDACPTDAFAGPGIVDARRCISYLTIEHRGAIDVDLRAGIGDRLFGCDICQEVCPWNARAGRIGGPPIPSSDHANSRDQPLPWDARGRIDLIQLLQLDDNGFRERFRKTPLWRPRRRGIVRNAAICAGNARETAALPALRALLQDADEVVRDAVQWAIDQIESSNLADPPGSGTNIAALGD